MFIERKKIKYNRDVREEDCFKQRKRLWLKVQYLLIY